MVLVAQATDTPGGRLESAPIAVAPVVAGVIPVRADPCQIVLGENAPVAVLVVTVLVPVALTPPQPFKGI